MSFDDEIEKKYKKIIDLNYQIIEEKKKNKEFNCNIKKLDKERKISRDESIKSLLKQKEDLENNLRETLSEIQRIKEAQRIIG